MKRHFLIPLLSLPVFFSTAWATGGKQDENPKETRPVQVTFITPLGSNGIEAPKITNLFSLNILTGVNGGLDGFELGGLVNVITGSIQGSQVGGLGNYVHQESSGVQIGGLFNVSRGYLSGMQIGGLTNLSLNEGQGSQLGGLLNVNNGAFKGLQMAGLVNANIREIDGFQLAGLVNYAGGDVNAGQIAGLLNVGLGNTHGIQIGGLVSVSGKSHEGAQISGLVNVTAEKVYGQIGGIANYAKRASGIQIGLINVADSVGGAQLGLISYSGNGHMAFGVQTNETFQGQLTFKMGLKRLYNVYCVAGSEGKNRYWAPGFGLGTYLLDGENASLNLEGLAYQVNEDDWWTSKLNMLARLNLNFQYKALRNFSLLGGISLNEAISKVRNAEGQLTGGSFIPGWTFYEHTGTRAKTTLYPGFNVGLEFRLK